MTRNIFCCSLHLIYYFVYYVDVSFSENNLKYVHVYSLPSFIIKVSMKFNLKRSIPRLYLNNVTKFQNDFTIIKMRFITKLLFYIYNIHTFVKFMYNYVLRF